MLIYSAPPRKKFRNPAVSDWSRPRVFGLTNPHPLHLMAMQTDYGDWTILQILAGGRTIADTE